MSDFALSLALAPAVVLQRPKVLVLPQGSKFQVPLAFPTYVGSHPYPIPPVDPALSSRKLFLTALLSEPRQEGILSQGPVAPMILFQI